MNAWAGQVQGVSKDVVINAQDTWASVALKFLETQGPWLVGIVVVLLIICGTVAFCVWLKARKKK